jgi:hypothetical protein
MRSGSRFSPDNDVRDEPDDPFADPDAWASATEAGYRKGRTRIGRAVHYRQPRMRRAPPRARSLFLLLLVFVLVDGALLVLLRPDLCPNNRCAPIHALITHYVPALNITASQAPAFSATPEKVSLQVVAGETQKADIILKNTGQATTAWAEVDDLKWVSTTPAAGALESAATVKVTISANPPGDTKPGNYSSSVSFTVGTTKLTVPVTIAVTAPKS